VNLDANREFWRMFGRDWYVKGMQGNETILIVTSCSGPGGEGDLHDAGSPLSNSADDNDFRLVY
jgi:hypothetical protein